MYFGAEQQRNVKLQTCPHYSDPTFNKPQIVFGKDRKGLEWVYSDRLQQWDYKKNSAAIEAANASGKPKCSADWYEEFLTAYYGKPIKLECVQAGVNVSNGYPYSVYGFSYK